VHGDFRHPEAGPVVKVRTQVRVCQRVPRESERFPVRGRVAETSRGGEGHHAEHDGPVARSVAARREEPSFAEADHENGGSGEVEHRDRQRSRGGDALEPGDRQLDGGVDVPGCVTAAVALRDEPALVDDEHPASCGVGVVDEGIEAGPRPPARPRGWRAR
jgi:hypothetical protein